MKTFCGFESRPFFSRSSPTVAKGKHFLPQTPRSIENVGFSFCLLIIMKLNYVQISINRTDFVTKHKLSPDNLTWLFQVYGKCFSFQ